VISLAKQLDHLAQSNGLERVDLEMQSPAYQNEELRNLAAVTSLARLAEEHLATPMAALSVGNTSSAELLLLLLLLLLPPLIIM
jgi:hypothetical protein